MLVNLPIYTDISAISVTFHNWDPPTKEFYFWFEHICHKQKLLAKTMLAY